MQRDPEKTNDNLDDKSKSKDESPKKDLPSWA
jgi:hypothetical protein